MAMTIPSELDFVLDLLEPAAAGIDRAADAAVVLKLKVIAELTITAAQIAAEMNVSASDQESLVSDVVGRISALEFSATE